MSLAHKLLARSVVVILLFGLLPAFQPPGVEAQNTASYNLTKYDCAPGYDPGSGDASAAFSNCVTPAAGVQFTLTSGDGNYGSSSQSTGGGGSAGWSGIPLGVGYSISESVPPGYGNPWVYCEVSGNPNNPGDVQRSFFQAPGGTMDVGYTDPSLTAYTQANCTWFDVVPNNGSTELKPQDQNGTDPIGSGFTVTIDIEKTSCPYGYAYQTASFSDLDANCGAPRSGVEFTIGGDQSTKKSTDGSGKVGFTATTEGILTIQEEAYAGYDTARVFCMITPSGAQQGAAFEASISEGNDDTQTASMDGLQSGDKIFCYWFNALVQEPHLAGLQIYKYLCPDDFAGAADFSGYSTGCSTPIPNPAFQLNIGAGPSDATGDANGLTTFLNYTAGTYTLKQTQPTGYYPVAVFCGALPLPTDESEKATVSQVPLSAEGVAQVELQAQYMLTCYWYDSATPPTTTDFGNVHLYKYMCDADFDWQNGGYDYLASGCGTAQEGVYFEIRNGGYTEGQTTSNTGEAHWSNVPTGDLSIVEQTPAGYQVGRVFCARVASGGSFPNTFEEVTYSEGIALPLDPGYDLYCVLFDVPSDYGTVHVYKYDCPEGFDWQNGGYDYLLAECTEPGSGIYFEMRSTSYQRGETTDASGAATWDDVPAGENTLYEDVPDGYQIARIFCGVAPHNAGSLPTSWEEYDYNSGIQIDIPSGEYVHCYVFDAHASYGTVYVYKLNCSSSHDWENTSYDYWLSGCTETATNVYFDVTQGTEVKGETTDLAGSASWPILGGDEIQIEEAVPDGYVLSQVFCGTIEIGGDPTDVIFDPMSANQPTTYDVPEGYDLYCTFFDFPSTTGTVTIVKYLCAQISLPLGSPGVDYDTLAAQCTEYGEGFLFSVTASDTGVYGASSGADGVATIEDLPAGAAKVSEALPAGYDSWGVYCTTDYPSGAYEEYAGPGVYEFDYMVEAGAHLYCSWFDQMPDYDATVEITKYICEEGDITSTNPGYMDYQSTCQDLGSGWKFQASSNGNDQTKSTGASGKVTFGFETAGSVTLTESALPGYGSLALWCNDGSSVDSWVQVPLTSASGTIALPSGAAWSCQWFNFHYPEGTAYPITIYKITCEHFLVRGTPTRADYEEHCTEPASGIEFTLSSGGGAVDTQSTDAAGMVLFEAPGLGSYTIEETPVEGYLTAAVYCQLSATSDPNQPMEMPVTFDVDSDYPIVCYWYNGEDIWGHVTSDPGTILIHKVDCPPGYPSDSSVGYEDLLNGCTLRPEEVTFSVNQNGSQVASGATNSEGEVALTGASIGMTRISELPVEGWDQPRVFCGSVPVTPARVLVSYEEQTVTTWGIDYDIPADTWLDCYWFDRVPYEGTDGQPIQIIVHKIVCDPGIDEPGDTWAGAQTECVTPEESVEFTITGGDGATASGPTDVNGYAEYNGMVAGDIGIRETPRDGYQTGEVYCATYYTSPTTFYRYPVQMGAIETFVAPGYTLECYWYNIVEQPTGHIYIFKYFCDEEVAYSSYDDFLGCSKGSDGVPFEVQVGAESWTEQTDGVGLAAFYDLPADPLDASLVREIPPDGYRPYAIFCGYSDVAYVPPTTFEEYELKVEDNSIEVVVTEDMYLMCYWYNVVDHYDPQVWFYKYDCHEDANWHWSYHQLLFNCTTPAPGVEFGFGPEGQGQSASITDDQGRWLYDDLTPGVWYWEEHFPAGYSGAVVYCQWVTPHGTGEYQKAELDGATLWMELDYDQVVTCYWFDFPDGHAPPSPTPHSGSGSNGNPPPPLSPNVPTGPVGNNGTTNQPSNPNAPATLIIVKYTCEPGYDIYADESDVDADCEELTEGIEFGLTDLTALAEADEDEEVLPDIQITDVDGEAIWTGLAAGPYLLVETMPEDTQEAFIWTCESDEREFEIQYPLTPFSYAGPAGQVGITLIPGETLECAWYNVPVAPATVTVLKFDCPGSVVIIAQCEPAGAGVQFALTPVGVVGPILELTTDDSGSATVDGPEGAYTLTETGGSPCLLDSETFDEEGNIVLDATQPAEVRVYNCGSGS